MNRGSWRGLAASLASGAVLACAEPGALLLTVDALPSLTADLDIIVAGDVVRDPPAATMVVVTVSGGAAPVADTITAGNQFAVAVTLQPDRLNTLALVAVDERGAASAPRSMDITHDGTGPLVLSMTPTGDGVSPTASIEVVFAEAVVQMRADAGIRIHRGGEVVPGTSAPVDSVTYWFVPNAPFGDNGVYELGFDGLGDAVGNPPLAGLDHCFVTPPPANVITLADSVGDYFLAGFADGDSPSDFVELRLSRSNDSLAGVLTFTLPRSFDTTAANNVMAVLELDTDQDSTTGVRTLKDTLFAGGPVDISTGMGAEFIIGVEPYTIPDTAYVGRYTQPLFFDVTHRFRPSICERFVGFALPVAALDADDGTMDMVLTAFNREGISFVLDPTPTSGSVEIDIGPIPVSVPSVGPRMTTPLRLRLPIDGW